MADGQDYMFCTVCTRETDTPAADLVGMFDTVRSGRRRGKLIARLCAEWRCDACLTEAEREADS